jgi:hypothetical protein
LDAYVLGIDELGFFLNEIEGASSSACWIAACGWSRQEWTALRDMTDCSASFTSEGGLHYQWSGWAGANDDAIHHNELSDMCGA